VTRLHEPDLSLVESFYDKGTPTFTHVVFDEDDGHAAIIDPALDFDPVRARTSMVSADEMLEFALGTAASAHCACR